MRSTPEYAALEIGTRLPGRFRMSAGAAVAGSLRAQARAGLGWLVKDA